jgi:hypothetical protein
VINNTRTLVLSKVSVRSGEAQVRIGVEATGTYSLDLTLALDADEQVQLMVINPRDAALCRDADPADTPHLQNGSPLLLSCSNFAASLGTSTPLPININGSTSVSMRQRRARRLRPSFSTTSRSTSVT